MVTTVKSRRTMLQLASAARRGDRKALGDALETLIIGNHGAVIDTNVNLGPHSLDAVTSGARNVALGDDALLVLTTGDDNVAIGAQSLDAATTGARNVAIGSNALGVLTIGTDNVAIGSGALDAATTGIQNVAIGTDALGAATVGVRNIAIGDDAMLVLTTGTDNVAIGAGALNAATTGVENVAIGTDALGACTIGTGNIAIGDDALLAMTTGVKNLAVGRDALLALTVGVNNVGIGDGAGATATTGTGNVVVGQGSDVSAAGAVDQIVLGRGVTGVADAAITLGNGTRAITCNYDADQTWDAPSDLRMKNVIGESALGLDFIAALRPIVYTHKPVSEWPAEWGIADDPTFRTDIEILGLGAQEVKAALDECGNPTFGGWSVQPNGQQQVGHTAFVMPLINAVKELKGMVTDLQAEIAALKAA